MKRAALLFVLAAVAAPSAQAPAPPKIELHTQFTLPNGLRVILHEDHRADGTSTCGTTSASRASAPAAPALRTCSST
jgi:hypothetical protein